MFTFINQQWIKPYPNTNQGEKMIIQRIKKLKLRPVSCATHYTWRTVQLQVLYSQTASLQLQWIRGFSTHPKHRVFPKHKNHLETCCHDLNNLLSRKQLTWNNIQSSSSKRHPRNCNTAKDHITEYKETQSFKPKPKHRLNRPAMLIEKLPRC